jgi:hypothetical protein
LIDAAATVPRISSKVQKTSDSKRLWWANTAQQICMAGQRNVCIVQCSKQGHIRDIDGSGRSDLLPALSGSRREIEDSALSSSLGPTFRAGRSPPDRPAHFISGQSDRWPCERRASISVAASLKSGMFTT